MTEKLKEGVTLPVWAISLMALIITALITFNISFASTQKQVEINTEVLKTKAEKIDVDRIYTKLDKIETLLIDQIIKTNEKSK